VDDRNIVKICDLGLARFTTYENQDTLFKARGSLAYMAPEVWSATTDGKSLGFTTKSDVYSFSIVLYEMVHRCYLQKWQVPYPNLNPFAIIANVSKGNLRPVINPKIPSSFSNLIQSCWDQDPDKRPNCLEILERLHDIQENYRSHKDRWENMKEQLDD